MVQEGSRTEASSSKETEFFLVKKGVSNVANFRE